MGLCCVGIGIVVWGGCFGVGCGGWFGLNWGWEREIVFLLWVCFEERLGGDGVIYFYFEFWSRCDCCCVGLFRFS